MTSAFKNVQAVYEKLGSEEPFWAVLSNRRYKRDVVDQQAFFDTGQHEISELIGRIEKQKIELPRGRALDFGCGVGRLTNALATHFDEVVGVDISKTMVENANQLCQHDNCRFVVNTQPDLSIFPDAHFDFVYSNITLQHIPMPASQTYVEEFLRIIKPDGLIVFLIPDGKDRPADSLASRMLTHYRENIRPLYKRLRGKYPVQIHPIARQQVEQIVQSQHGQIFHTNIAEGFEQKKRKFKPIFYWVKRAA